MKTLDKIRLSLSQFISPAKNAMTLPQQFLRYGNREKLYSDWSEVIMDDRDFYTGYSYAAIRNRAVITAKTAIDNIRTESNKDDFVHPYLTSISDSPTFTDFMFWFTISTYLDLEGVFYLMAVRNIDTQRVGNIKEFKLLNPYNIRRVIDPQTLTVKGYIEAKLGFIREIPKEMIIEMRELNPFDDNKNYAMTDAAKDYQYTIKTAGDFTRQTLKHDINAPGILSTDVILDKPEFENFIERVRNHKKGEPIFGNGQGAITWESMQVELSKAALKDINEINREALFAISGVSKTLMGVEQSGVTRETSKVQKDLNMENHILPRIQLIIDALNQDYKNYWLEQYNKNKAVIVVDNPFSTNHEADILEIELKSNQFELYNKLVNKGYDHDIASQYVLGELSLDQLGEPTNEPILPPITPPKGDKDDVKEDESVKLLHEQNNAINEVSKLIQSKI